MIYRLIDLPPNVIGFKVLWHVTEKDFEEVVLPSVQNHVEQTEQLNCLLVLNNSIKNFRLGAFKGLKRLAKWNKKWKRVAVVGEPNVIKRLFIGLLNMFVPVEIRSFSNNEMREAIDWAAEKKPENSGQVMPVTH